jgi:hypothetical protein
MSVAVVMLSDVTAGSRPLKPFNALANLKITQSKFVLLGQADNVSHSYGAEQ